MRFLHRNREVLRYLWIPPFVLGLVIALFAPADILKYQYINFLVGSIRDVVPMVNKIGATNELWQVAQLYFSFLWLTCPLVYLSILLGGHIDKKKLKVGMTHHPIFLAFFCALLLPSLSLFLFLIGPGEVGVQDRSFFTVNTRFGMATYGFLIPGGAYASLALTTVWVRTLLNGN